MSDDRPKEEWPDERVRQECYTALLRSAFTSKERFDAAVTGGNNANSGRFVVSRMHCSYPTKHAANPFQAVRNAIELDFSGGWTWYVWDKETQIGYQVAPNEYIYQPLENAIREDIDALTIRELELLLEDKKKKLAPRKKEQGETPRRQNVFRGDATVRVSRDTLAAYQDSGGNFEKQLESNPIQIDIDGIRLIVSLSKIERV